MNDINWDDLQRQVDEHNSDCPWIENDKEDKRQREEWIADEEED